MKNLISTIEGIWTSIIPIELSTSQIETLNNHSIENNNNRIELLNTIKQQTESNASDDDSALAQSNYMLNKPELKDTDTYSLASVNITIDENDIQNGIINFTLNGEYKQIRF